MKVYGFTVTKQGTPETPISKITGDNYVCVWRHWESHHANIIYKYEHHGVNHIHYHGTIHTSTSWGELMYEGYSIKFEVIEGTYERWHNYCKHELNEKITKLEEREFERRVECKFQKCIRRIRDRESYDPQKRQQSNILFQLKITGNI